MNRRYTHNFKNKGRKARNTTMKDNINFDRFINVMADLITKYADKIDLDSLPDVEMPEAETSVSASFFAFIGKWSAEYFKAEKYRNISVFLGLKGVQNSN